MGSLFHAQPLMYAMMVVFVLVFTSVIFGVYDSIVERRQRKVAQTAVESTAVIHSLFPSNVRDRLLQQQQQEHDTSALVLGGRSGLKHPARAFLNNGDRTMGNNRSSPPIADLFPFTTVLFADIAGFTAWSSSREPTQASVLFYTYARHPEAQ
jgi:class 3 adenylate cyclase